jgi:flavin-binding protein dodecin
MTAPAIPPTAAGVEPGGEEVRAVYKRILLPLDGSPLAEQAIPHAIAQASHSQAELILLRVIA